jgi:hypothetical protein
MKKGLSIFLFFIVSHIFAQNMYMGYPSEKIKLNKGDVIVAGYIDWRYSGFFSSIDTLVDDMKSFMLKNLTYKFVIKIYRGPDGNEEWLLNVSQKIANDLDYVIRQDTVFAKRVSYKVIGVGVSKVLFSNEIIAKEEDVLYKTFMDRMNRRVEIVIE